MHLNDAIRLSNETRSTENCALLKVLVGYLVTELRNSGKKVGLHRISAPANLKSGHFSQIRLQPNFYPDLGDASAAAVHSVH